MPGLVRIGDPVSCGDTVCEGSGNVFANGLPVTRQDVDSTCGHCYSPTTFPSGSPTVFVNNQPVIRVGDSINPHTCNNNTHGGVAQPGSIDVFADS